MILIVGLVVVVAVVLCAILLSGAFVPLLLVAVLGNGFDANGQPIHQTLQSEQVAIGPQIPFNPSSPVGSGRPSQFALGLSAADAYAACGLAAAIAYAQSRGRPMSIAEVMGVARRGYWDSGTGMHGPASEVAMLRDLGVPALLEAINWAHVVAEASTGHTVILDTPGHYYVVDAVRADGRLHVGTSGTDLRGGSDWMAPAEINAMPISHGSVRADLYAPPPPAPTGHQ